MNNQDLINKISSMESLPLEAPCHLNSPEAAAWHGGFSHACERIISMLAKEIIEDDEDLKLTQPGWIVKGFHSPGRIETEDFFRDCGIVPTKEQAISRAKHKHSENRAVAYFEAERVSAHQRQEPEFIQMSGRQLKEPGVITKLSENSYLITGNFVLTSQEPKIQEKKVQFLMKPDAPTHSEFAETIADAVKAAKKVSEKYRFACIIQSRDMSNDTDQEFLFYILNAMPQQLHWNETLLDCFEDGELVINKTQQ
jgi:hypothetical protein